MRNHINLRAKNVGKNYAQSFKEQIINRRIMLRFNNDIQSYAGNIYPFPLLQEL